MELHKIIRKMIIKVLPEMAKRIHHIDVPNEEKNLLIQQISPAVTFQFQDIKPMVSGSGIIDLTEFTLQTDCMGTTDEVAKNDTALLKSLMGRTEIDDVSVVLIPQGGTEVEEAENLVKRIMRTWKGILEA